ncbi:MAG: SRPBCC family protein [Actinomycetota bacterium]
MPATVVERSGEVAATPVEVWAVLGDFPAISRWAPHVDYSCALGATEVGPGAARRIQAGRSTLVERVLVWDPPTTLSYSVEGLPPIVRSATNTWTVGAAPIGATVSLASRLEVGPRPPHRLAGRVVARLLARTSERLLAALAADLDTTRGATA